MPEIIQNFLQVHISLAPVVSIVLRTFSIVLAPIPGTPIDLINIALFGKGFGFLYAEISMMIGSVINFWIGRKFREPALKNFIPIEKIHIWEERIREKSGFWGLTLIRMATVPIFDYLSYVSGLTKISFWKFFVSSLIATIPPTALFYYLGGTFLERRFYLALILIVPLVMIYILFQQGKIFKKLSEYLSVKDNIKKMNGFVDGGEKENSQQ